MRSRDSMGRVLTYLIEEEPSKALLGMRMKGVDNHLTFDGDEAEGEFSKRYPQTSMELRGLYTIDDDMLSIIITDMPEEETFEGVKEMFQGLLEGPADRLR
jgi:hypothetical protein